MRLTRSSKGPIRKIADTPSLYRKQWLEETSDTLGNMSLEHIERLCHQPAFTSDGTHEGERSVTRLSHQITTKACEQPGEAYAMLLVQDKTSIPTPKVLRMFLDEGPGKCRIVLEKIEGVTLESCWETLSLWQKISVAKILKRYVRALRNIQTTQITLLRIPGPVLGEKGLKNSQPCVGPGWVDGVNDACSGSFPLPCQSDLANWFNERLRISYDYHDTDTYMIPFDDSEHLVFVLGSLSMDNIIIDEEGCLWLTDFSRAGVYPPWFEYCGMRGDQHKRMPQSWKWLRRFVCGSYSDQERFLRQVNRIPVKPRKYTKTRLLSRSSRRLSPRPSMKMVPERHIQESFV